MDNRTSLAARPTITIHPDTGMVIELVGVITDGPKDTIGRRLRMPVDVATLEGLAQLARLQAGRRAE